MPVSTELRDALRLADEASAGLVASEAAWTRFRSGTVPRGFAITVALVSPALFLTSIPLALAVTLGALPSPVEPRALLGAAFAVIPFGIPAGVYLYQRSLSTSQADVQPVAFAAAGPIDEPACRQCGAPLRVEGAVAFVRCPYCTADNLVALDVRRERALRATVARAGVRLADAVASLAEREATARSSANLMLGIGAVLSIPSVLGGLTTHPPEFAVWLTPWAVGAQGGFALGFPVAYALAWWSDLAVDSPMSQRRDIVWYVERAVLVACLVSLVWTGMYIYVAWAALQALP